MQAAALPALAQAAVGAAPGRVQAESTSAKPAGGPQEGIKVHGHWVIEVRNPDGSLAAHREFENSLATTAGNNGGGVLAALLGGAITAGSWSVFLTPGGSLPAFFLAPANSAASASCIRDASGGTGGSFTCFTGLTVTPPVVSVSQGLITGSTLTLAGTFIVPDIFPQSRAPSQIGYVETDAFACAPTDTSAQCFNAGASFSDFTFTSRNLDGVGTDPNPVPVNNGQSVNVTVTLSFQ